MKHVLGITLAFLGVILVISPLEWSLNPLGVIGNLLSLGSAMCWAFYSVLSKKILSDYGAAKITVFSLIYGTIYLFPATFILEKPVLPISVRVWFPLLVLSLFCSGLAYLFWCKALENVSATKAGSFLFFVPIVSVLIAYFVLSEFLNIPFAIGALFVTVGVLITAHG